MSLQRETFPGCLINTMSNPLSISPTQTQIPNRNQLIWARCLILSIATFITQLLPGTAHAQRAVARYHAGLEENPTLAPSPAILGWNGLNPTNDLQNFENSPVSPDGSTGLNAWRTLDNSNATSQFITWTHPINSQDHASATQHGWTLAARVRITDPAANNASGRSATFSYGNGSRRWLLFFDINANGQLVVDLWGTSSAVTTIILNDLNADAYHEHKLVWNPVTNQTNYLVNDVLRHSGYNGATSSFNGVRFGTESSGGRGDAHWNEVILAVDEPTPQSPRPIVTSHPQHSIKPVGSTINLTAAFSGNTTHFQWFKNGYPIPNSNTATLVIDPVSISDEGDYWCRAFNGPEAWAETITAAVTVLTPGTGLRITEFIASNAGGIHDEDGDRQDWIELFNADTAPVSTASWHLSDNSTNPSKWLLPEKILQPGEFIIIFASGKNRAPPFGQWHTNFSLSTNGEEVILTRPDQSTANSITFGHQVADVSMGTTASGWKFFDPPSPGFPNSNGRNDPGNLEILFDPPPGVHGGTIEVSISTTGQIPPGAVLRYTTNDHRPDATSPLVVGPITINENTPLRVALIAPGERYGIATSAPYLVSGITTGGFSSPLPLLVLSNFSGGNVPGISAYGPNNDGSQVTQVAPQSQMMTLLEDASGQAVTLDSPATAWTRTGIRRRGSSSFNFSRHSYRLDTWGDRETETRNISLLGMPAESDWVLYAPDSSQFDITLIHNAFSYELARRSGFNAPRFRLVELFLDINGDGIINMIDHRGLYLLVETVKRDPARVSFSRMSNDGSQGGWMTSIDRMDSLPPGSNPAASIPRHFHTAGPDGILQTPDDTARGFKGTGGGGGLDPIRDDQPNAYHSFFNFVSPRGWDILPTQRSTIQNVMRNFDAALYGADYQNETLGWARHIDARNWAHHLALHQLSRNQDAILLSSYLYQESPESPIRWASLWDFDRAYRRMDSNPNNNLTWAQNRVFYQRLFTDPEFVQIHTDTWQELRRGAFATTEMHNLIDELTATITPDVAARSGISASTWQTNIENLKSWLATRAASIDGLDPEPPAFTHAGGPLGPGLALGMSAISGTIYFTTDGSDPRQRGGTPAPAATSYTAPFEISTPMTVTARNRASNGKWSGPVTAVFFSTEIGPRFLPGGNATWNEIAHWESGYIPNGTGQAATINQPETNNRTITLDSPTTIGKLLFDEQDSNWVNQLQGSTPNSLTFQSATNEPANIIVTGSGNGHVEFDVDANINLISDLIIDVQKTNGSSAYGALRMRRSWTGPGGLRKQGLGVATLSGSGKNWLGETVVAQGVLTVTGIASPSNSSAIRILEGGQLRLSSNGNPLYTFGGPVFIAGNGRGAEILDDADQGNLGAIRYEPGSTGNHATLTNRVDLTSPSHIHVATQGNLLTVAEGLSGHADLSKSGGGTLILPANPHVFSGDIHCTSGSIILRGDWDSAVSLAAQTHIDASGTTGNITGIGTLRVTDGLLKSSVVSGVSLEIAFQPESPTLIAESLDNTPTIDLFRSPSLHDNPTAGIILPNFAAWENINFQSIRVFIPDPLGERQFNGSFWSQQSGVTITRVPSPWPEHPGVALQIRMDGSPADFDTWADLTFRNSTDAAIAGPLATPFGDGIANLLRFALGTDNNGHVRLPLVLRDADGSPRIQFPYDPGLRGLHWKLLATENITSWENADVLFDSQTGPIPNPNGFIEVVDQSGLPSRFFRLQLNVD